jgi:hypothetical protein
LTWSNENPKNRNGPPSSDCVYRLFPCSGVLSHRRKKTRLEKFSKTSMLLLMPCARSMRRICKNSGMITTILLLVVQHASTFQHIPEGRGPLRMRPATAPRRTPLLLHAAMGNRKKPEKNPSQPATAGHHGESREGLTKTPTEKRSALDRRALITCLGAAALGASSFTLNNIVPEAQAKGVGFVGRGFDRIDSIPDKLGFNSNTKVKTTPLDPKALQQFDADLREQIEVLKTIRDEAKRWVSPWHHPISPLGTLLSSLATHSFPV